MSVVKKALYDALLVLTGHKSAKDRLRDAWLNYLCDLQPEDLPEGPRQKFQAISDGLSSQTPVNKEHPAEATIRKMSPHQAARWNKDIVSLYVAVIAEGEPVQLRLVDANESEEGTSDPVPDFLIRH